MGACDGSAGFGTPWKLVGARASRILRACGALAEQWGFPKMRDARGVLCTQRSPNIRQAETTQLDTRISPHIERGGLRLPLESICKIPSSWLSTPPPNIPSSWLSPHPVSPSSSPQFSCLAHLGLRSPHAPGIVVVMEDVHSHKCRKLPFP